MGKFYAHDDEKAYSDAIKRRSKDKSYHYWAILYLDVPMCVTDTAPRPGSIREEKRYIGKDLPNQIKELVNYGWAFVICFDQDVDNDLLEEDEIFNDKDRTEPT